MKHKSILLLLIVLLAFPQMSETLITPSLPGIATTLGSSMHLVELSLSFFFAGFAIGVSLWGIASDQYGRRPTLLLGLGFFVLGSIACSVSNHLWHLLLSTFLQAFGASAGSVITQTVLRDVYTESKERARIFAIIGMALSFSPAVGPLIGSSLDTLLGFRANYAFLAILGIGLIGWVTRALPETRPETCKVRSLAELRSLSFSMLLDAHIVRCSALIGLCNGVLFCFFAEGPFIFIQHLGMSATEYGLIGLVVSIASLLAGVINRRWIGSGDIETLICYGAACMCLGSFGYVLVCMTGITHIAWFIAAFFTVFLGMGILISNVLSIALKNYQAIAGSAGSLFGLSYYAILTVLTGGMSLLHGENLMVFALYLLGMSSVTALIAVALKKTSTASVAKSH